jgi:hypothetical protein
MRALVISTMLAVVSLFVLAVPGLYPRFSVPCADALDQCLLYPQQVAPLAMLGLTPSSLTLITIAISYVVILLVILIAIAILWRRSDDWMALFLALTLILMPALFTSLLQALPDSWQGIQQVLNDAAIATFFLLIALFPNGRFAPRWLWLPTLAIIAVAIIPFPSISDSVESVVTLVLGLTTLGACLCLIASQVYRYRRVSSAVERQQIKWGVYGFILAIIVNQAYWQPLYWIPSLRRLDSLYSLLAIPDSLLILCIVAISFFVAIQRYRLYDIDPLVNKALVYGSLSVILAIVYISGVIGMQALARTITGQDSPIALVASTLLIAGLFQPLRGLLQKTIDRRFYRAKYDAQKALAAFNATLRQEVSLTELQERLVRIVNETVQPAHVSLWIAPRPTAKLDTPNIVIPSHHREPS